MKHFGNANARMQTANAYSEIVTLSNKMMDRSTFIGHTTFGRETQQQAREKMYEVSVSH
jgi:hypothetical protein